MKTIFNLLIILTIILSGSCCKDEKDPCIDGICPCEDTIYISYRIPIDTFIIDEADYIWPFDSKIDTFHASSVDSFHVSDNFIANYGSSIYKHLLSEDDSISFVLRGGTSYIYEEPPYIFSSELNNSLPKPCDSTNSVIIYDTVYYTRYNYLPYAILEIFEGSKSYIDTAFYPNSFNQYRYYHEDNMETYLTDITNIFKENGYKTDIVTFDEYLKKFYNIGNTGYFFVDIFRLHNNFFYDSQFILFKDN